MAQTRSDGVKRKAAIVAAARAVFADVGVADTSVEDIRRAARASPSSLYHHFSGLRDVQLAVLEAVFVDLFAALGACVHRAAAPHEAGSLAAAEAAVQALVRGHLAFVEAQPGDARAMYELTSVPLSDAERVGFLPRKAAAMAPMLEALAPALKALSVGRAPWPIELLDVVCLGPAHEAARRALLGAPFDLVALSHTLPRLAWVAVRTLHEDDGPATPSPARRRKRRH